MIEKLADSIINDVVSGLNGLVQNLNMSKEQLIDEITDERLQIIKEYGFKNLIPKRDLLMSVNCIEVDCKSLDRCPCSEKNYSKPIAHFELPQLIMDIPGGGIEFIGSVDRSIEFKPYTSLSFKYHKYKRRGAEKPYVYIDTTPNENNKYDGWIFNAPMLKVLSAIIIPKDLRQISEYNCCYNEDIQNYTFISTEIRKRLIEKKLRYYRQFYQLPQPNNQVAR